MTNGSVTAFYLIAQAWSGAKSIIGIPSFSEYEDACRLHKHQISFFQTSDDLSDLNLEGQDFCWIYNPEQSGRTTSPSLGTSGTYQANPQTTFVVDQAYVAFTTEELLKASDLKTLKNLIIVQSISKSYNIPGLRIGYVMTTPEKAAEIAKHIIPWASALWPSKPANSSWFILLSSRCLSASGNAKRWIWSINFTNWTVWKWCQPKRPSSSYVWKKKPLPDLKKFLLEKYGILIRDASNFRGLDESYIRLSTRRPTNRGNWSTPSVNGFPASNNLNVSIEIIRHLLSGMPFWSSAQFITNRKPIDNNRGKLLPIGETFW